MFLIYGVVDTEVLEVKLRGSSIWHNRVLEVTREGLRKQRRSLKAEKRRIERDCAPLWNNRAKEHRLSKPRTKEKARPAARAAAEVVSRD